MTNEQIENFLVQTSFNKSKVLINFKSRSPITGIFIKTPDYTELKTKNLWRIVSESKIEEFLNVKDTSIAKIFNGTEITKLSLAKVAVAK
jgi:hypothetical protein